MPRIGFTDHAIDQFIARVAPAGVTNTEAREFLEARSWSASRLKEKTNGGQSLWKIEDPWTAYLVCKHDGKDLVCVTVLSENEYSATQVPEVDPILAEWLEEQKEEQRRKKEQETAVTVAQAATVAPAAPAPRRPAASRWDFRREIHLAVQKATIAKQQEKTKRHHDHETQEATKAKRCLKLALLYLRQHIVHDPDAAVAWHDIGAIDPGFLSTSFIDLPMHPWKGEQK